MTVNEAQRIGRKVNRLIDSTSPYLLQHAHNPVDWYPWGPEALEKARREDKPIFLSIGYAACHWCHVMERESFENPAIAAILNEHFVSIKVDREERPDLDELYMKATILYNQGNGGWPMSVFLLPADQTPFFAGTYFPPVSSYGRPGFADLLMYIADLWRRDRARIVEAAGSMVDAVREFSSPRRLDGEISDAVVSDAVAGIAAVFDPDRGGVLSGTNKFPPSQAISLMLRQYERSRQAGRPNHLLLERVRLTLDHMADGGIYDHLAGGIARYSTDPDWLVPHFEKMLYDQALVSGAYIEAFQVTAHQRYADVASDILNYVLSDMRSPEGAFYSSWDADSEGVEGQYYVWSRAEVLAELGDGLGDVFCDLYDVTEEGNWEGRNILNIRRDAAAVAGQHGLTASELEERRQEARKRLLDARRKRVAPGLDDKIVTGWNGLMIGSLARGAIVLKEPRYAQAAEAAARFLLSSHMRNGRLLRTSRRGVAHTPAFLDDYAFLIEGLLDLHQMSFEWQWIEEAVRLAEEMVRQFWDDRHGGFFLSAGDSERLFARTKECYDGAIPSGNSAAIMDLLRLGNTLGRDDLLEKAELAIRSVGGNLLRSPFGQERLLAAIDARLSPATQILIVGSPAEGATHDLIDAAREGYGFDRTLLLLDPGHPDASSLCDRIPMLAGKRKVDGLATAYVCIGRTCRPPVTSPGGLRTELQLKCERQQR